MHAELFEDAIGNGGKARPQNPVVNGPLTASPSGPTAWAVSDRTGESVQGVWPIQGAR